MPYQNYIVEYDFPIVSGAGGQLQNVWIIALGFLVRIFFNQCGLWGEKDMTIAQPTLLIIISNYKHKHVYI